MTIRHHQPQPIRHGEPRLALPDVPTWMSETLCSSVDPALFFGEHGKDQKYAKQVCSACPAQLACLRYALEENISAGIWGGLNPNERARIKKASA